MSAPNDEGRKELADMPHLSDVQATDALLDRLAARTPTADDLKDPVIADLALLAEYADASPVPSPGVERLIEVLDGRPLYMFEHSTAEVSEDDRPIQLGEIPAARTIDLREPATSPAASGVGRADGIAARATGTEDVVPMTKLALLRSRRNGELKHGWQGVVQQLALPAASVAALLFLGGGVSAVVTGDPMAPVNGVTRVLTGNDPAKNYQSAQSALDSAQAYVLRNQPDKASQLVAQAQKKVDDVPEESKQALKDQIATVAAQVNAAASAAANPATSAAPTPAASTPVETPTPSTPAETAEPSSTPSDSPSETPTADESTASDAAAAGNGAGNGNGNADTAGG